MSKAITANLIIQQLADLRQKDRKLLNFGAEEHRYALNPPIAEQTLARFESVHRIALPDDYRLFLTEIGNGGAGPFYGVFRFGEHDDGHEQCKWEDGYLLGDVSKPFEYTEAWNLPESFWDGAPEAGPDTSDAEEERLYDEWNAKLEKEYWNNSIMDGAIPICHQGCAYRIWLVVHGPERGHVWGDDRADSRGISPVSTPDNPRMTFGMWYLYWLQHPKSGGAA